jgi:hypothetical protein
MCHPAWGRAHAPAPFPRELVRVRRAKDRIDRDAARRAQAAHDGAPRLPLDLTALAACSGLPQAQLAGEFTRAYGVSPEAYLSACEGGTAAASRCHSECSSGSTSGRSVASGSAQGEPRGSAHQGEWIIER